MEVKQGSRGGGQAHLRSEGELCGPLGYASGQPGAREARRRNRKSRFLTGTHAGVRNDRPVASLECLCLSGEKQLPTMQENFGLEISIRNEKEEARRFAFGGIRVIKNQRGVTRGRGPVG